MARTPTPGARERILDRAACLFYERGIHAVGLQQVIDECGCGKNMLYREFGSKDDLVVAYLERLRAESNAKIDAAIAAHDDPATQLVAVVRSAVDEVSTADYRGCAFHSAAVEYRDPDHPANRVSVGHIGEMRQRLRTIAKHAGAAAPAKLADELMLVIDGVYSSGFMLGKRGPSRAAIALAERLVAEATRPS